MDNIGNQRFAEFADRLLRLRPEQQENVWGRLQRIVTPAEFQALQIGVSFYSMAHDPEKYEAMKKAVGEKIYKELTEAKV